MMDNTAGYLLMTIGLMTGAVAFFVDPRDLAVLFYEIHGAVFSDLDALSIALMLYSAKLMLAIFAAALFVAGAIFARPQTTARAGG